LVDSADQTVSEVRVAVAFTTLSGCELLIPALAEGVGHEQWEAIPKTFVTGFDFGITEPAALAYLQGLPNCTVRIANVPLNGQPQLMPAGTTFHPKLYVFSKDDRREVTLGSPNLSRPALTVNTEVVEYLPDLDAGGVDALWGAIEARSVPLTPELLEAYAAMRPAHQAHPPPQHDEPLPPVAPPLPGVLPVFREAVEAAGGVDPSVFPAFWVEAGAMSSSASHSQLELPRLGHRFFVPAGFADYDDLHRVIAGLSLTVGHLNLPNRPLTWHGNNKMERINLPTQAMGGPAYQGTAILFRRREGDFEVTVVPWDSPEAVAWREESAANGHLYRLGHNSARVCGLL
jgi:hypothetical protein